MYGRTDPRPGNFKPLYAGTPDFIAAVKQVTGKDYQWFFDVYLYQPALPELVATRDGDTLRWTGRRRRQAVPDAGRGARRRCK